MSSDKFIIRMLLVMLLFTGSRLTVFAQYNPDNPDEPNLLIKVTMESEPANVAYLSGVGSYQPGQQIDIGTSASNYNFQFDYWTIDGVKTSNPQNFSYTIVKKNVHFVAHYKYLPVNPNEPSVIQKGRIYLVPDPDGSCSFNRTSGLKAAVESYTELEAFGNQGYVFAGWFSGGTKISDNNRFNYYMENADDVTLNARFTEYNPGNPLEPVSDGQHVYNKRAGDINDDKMVDVSDVVLLINHYLNNTTSELDTNVADVNKDGVIDIADVVSAVNIYLNNK